MKKIKWFALACMAAIAVLSCEGLEEPENETEEESKEPEYVSKTWESEISFEGYLSDTVIIVKDFIAELSDIRKDVDWLGAEILDSTGNSLQIKVFCLKNSTANARKAQIVITFKNGDTVILKITQNVCDDFDLTHDNVSDQPTLSPAR